jgi:hypothetical protein
MYSLICLAFPPDLLWCQRKLLIQNRCAFAACKLRLLTVNHRRVPVPQLFASQHVVLRGRCSKVTLQLVGYPLISAPQLIKVQ